MKAPDKIYISRNENVHGRLFDDDTEYIRKEAVLALVDKLSDEAPSYDDSRVYLGRAYELINSL